MLVLSRERQQRIVIGEGVNQVIVTLVDIRGGKARFGIDADPKIAVHREEVYAAILAERGALPRVSKPA